MNNDNINTDLTEQIEFLREVLSGVIKNNRKDIDSVFFNLYKEIFEVTGLDLNQKHMVTNMLLAELYDELLNVSLFKGIELRDVIDKIRKDSE